MIFKSTLERDDRQLTPQTSFKVLLSAKVNASGQVELSYHIYALWERIDAVQLVK